MNGGFTDQELALAYELRQEGCCWKRIAEGLGCNYEVLRAAVRRATVWGVHKKRYSDELMQSMLAVKAQTRLSWRSLAGHIGTDPVRLRWACNDYAKAHRRQEA